MTLTTSCDTFIVYALKLSGVNTEFIFVQVNLNTQTGELTTGGGGCLSGLLGSPSSARSDARRQKWALPDALEDTMI